MAFAYKQMPILMTSWESHRDQQSSRFLTYLEETLTLADQEIARFGNWLYTNAIHVSLAESFSTDLGVCGSHTSGHSV